MIETTASVARPHQASKLPPPHEPRRLSGRELRVFDTYEFLSPKNGPNINVIVVEPSRLALALALEFDPSVTCYVERPRYLTVGDGIVELCFWHRCEDGRERYDLITNQKEATAHASRQAERKTALTFEAAVAAGIDLRIRKASHFLSEKTANTTRLLLLGYVQAAQTLVSAPAIEQAIEQHLSHTPRTTFYYIQRALCAFKACDVLSQASRMIHMGVLSLDWETRLSLSSMVWRQGAES